MKCFQDKYISIASRVKALYYLCKIAGLAPFSIIVNPKDAVETIDIDAHLNVLSVAWSLLVFCMLLTGTVYYCVVMVSKTSATAHHITAFMVSFPMSMLMALLSILFNLTANRRKFSELFKKLNFIDVALFKYDVSSSDKWFKVEMGLLLFVLIPWLCVDSWLWGHRMGLVGEGTLRMSHLIQFLVIMQFCKFTQFLRHILKLLNRALSSSVEDGEKRLSVIRKEVLNNKCTSRVSTDIRPIIDCLPAPSSLTSVEDTSEDKNISDKLIKTCDLLGIRRTYGLIYDAAECVDSIYGPSVLLEFVRNILAVIVNMFLLIVHLRSPTEKCGLYEFSGLCWIVFFIFRQVAIIVSCHLTMSEACKLQDNVQRALLRHHVSPEALEQLKMFSVQLAVNTIKFTAFGFFTLNLSTLSTFFASVITYIVVLAQFN
jgi:hypothetical protein